MNFTPSTFIEIIALCFSLFFIPRLIKSRFIILLPLLLLTVIIELFSTYIFSVTKSSHWLHNIFIGIEIIIFFYFFYYYEVSKKLKQMSLYFIGSFVLFYLVNILFFQKPFIFNYYTFLFGSFLLVINACYFIMELMKTNINGIFKTPMFWLSTGVLFFFAITTIFFSFFNYLVLSKKVNVLLLYRVLITFANFILYTCLSISMLLFWKKKPLS
jgi:hypothetical protein